MIARSRQGHVVRRRVLRRSTIAVALIVGLVSCAKSATPGGTPSSGIQGIVTVGPQCPVVQAESPCPDTPFKGKVQVSQSGKGVLAQVQADAIGGYRFALAPGTYVVEPVLPGSGGPPTALPRTVVVHADAFTQADLSVDTGIR